MTSMKCRGRRCVPRERCAKQVCAPTQISNRSTGSRHWLTGRSQRDGGFVTSSRVAPRTRHPSWVRKLVLRTRADKGHKGTEDS